MSKQSNIRGRSWSNARTELFTPEDLSSSDAEAKAMIEHTKALIEHENRQPSSVSTLNVSDTVMTLLYRLVADENKGLQEKWTPGEFVEHLILDYAHKSSEGVGWVKN